MMCRNNDDESAENLVSLSTYPLLLDSREHELYLKYLFEKYNFGKKAAGMLCSFSSSKTLPIMYSFY